MKNDASKNKIIEDKKIFKEFSPSWPSSTHKLQHVSVVGLELYQIIQDDIHGSCLWEVVEGRSLSRERIDKMNSIECPTLLELAENFKKNNQSMSVASFNEYIKITDKQIEAVKKKTINQSLDETWFNQRVGRITASKFYRIFTRSKTLQTLEEDKIMEASISIVSEVMNYKPNITTFALKHGISMEPHAKKMYIAMSKNKHKNLKTEEAGLIINIHKPYVAVSPDLEVECDCCGKGLLEVKSPYSIKGEQPTACNLPYLEQTLSDKNEKITTLKTDCSYYFQVQGQLAVSGRNYCDFLVYTTAGYHLERIFFNQIMGGNANRI